MSSSNCCFLTCIQISQEAGQVVWYSHLFQNYLQNFSLIPRMLVFTHVISYLTIFSLPWFMDLTFQVLMQYCSLQHWTLFYHQIHPQWVSFLIWPRSSFFLELFLISSPIVYWKPTNLSGSCSGVISFCLWLCGSQGKNTGVSWCEMPNMVNQLQLEKVRIVPRSY